MPVLITEHGADLDDSQDHRRAAFIQESIRELAVAIARANAIARGGQ